MAMVNGSMAARGHAAGECEGCKEMSRAVAIMVAGGFMSAEKFEQAREIVRG